MGIKSFLKTFGNTKENEQNGVVVERKTTNYDTCKEIGVLFSSSHEDNHKAINYFVKLLQKDGKNIHVLAYFEEKHSNPFDFRFDFFTKQDIDRQGNINSLQVNEFMERNFDYLYCVNPIYLDYFDFILRRSKAKCRVGRFHPQSTDCFELMVDTFNSTDTVDLILQMLHYTKGLIIHNSETETTLS